MGKIQTSDALKSIRIIDMSRVRAGPNCVRILTDYGADVIRVEPPRGVDPNEGMFANNRAGGDFQNLNRNKRSLTLNLKKPGALEVFMELVKTADVVVENWRPDVKKKLGIDYDSLAKVNPRIILASISGYGQTGPYSKRPGFDQIMQGMGGLMSVTGHPGGGPVRAGLAVADMSAGLYTAIGIMIALFERQFSGKGQWVHSSLLHSQIAMMDFQVSRFLNDGDIPVQVGNDHPTSSPMGLFTASDGVLNIGASGQGNWLRLCQVLGREDWIDHPDFKNEILRRDNRKRLTEMLEAEFGKNTVAHWVEKLNEAGVPAGPVYSVPEVVEDEQVKHLGVVKTLPESFEGRDMHFITQPVALSRTPADIKTAAPACGEHTVEVLKELGFSDEQVSAWQAQGVV